VAKEYGARYFSVVASEQTRGNGHKVKHEEFYLNARLFFFFFHWKDDQTLEQVAQRCCAVSILGDTKNLIAHVPR